MAGQVAKRIKICQLITRLGQAGAEKCIFELSTKLDRRYFDTWVIGLQSGAMVDKLRSHGIAVEVLGLKGKWDFPRLGGLIGLLKKMRPDILHTHLFHADLAGRLAGTIAGVKRIVTTVHVAEMRFRPWHFAFARLADGLCDKIVCVSKSVRDFHMRRSGLPKNRYLVIPNGVDTAAYQFDAKARSAWRGRLGVDDSVTLAVFIGRLDRQKGLDVLLDVMDSFAVGGKEVRFAIAGEGPQKAMLDDFVARRPGRTLATYVGLTDDVRGLLCAADIFVMPSRWEGYGLAMAEAMAAGRACLGTRVPGLMDIVPPDAGILIEPDNPLALAEAIEKLADDVDMRTTLGRAAQNHANKNLDIGRFIRDHESLYAELLTGEEK